MAKISSVERSHMDRLEKKIKNKVSWMLFILLLILGSNGTTWASEPSGIILVTGEWAPYTSKGLENYGFFTAIVSEIFRKMDQVPEYKFYPWKRCELQLEKGNAFAAFPYAYTKERAKKFWFTDLMTLADDSTEPTRLFFYKKSAGDFRFDELEDLRAYKIAGIAGYYYLELFDEAGIAYDYSDNETDAFRKLVGGRVDLVPIIQSAGNKVIKRLYPGEPDHFGVLPKSISGAGTRLMVSRAYPRAGKIMKRFNMAFKEIVKDGTYLRILKKHGMQRISIIKKDGR